MAGQWRTDPERQERGSSTAWGFPLPPQRCAQSQPDPAGQVHQHVGRFAEAEIAAPTPHIRSQFFYRRLDADAFRPSRDLSNPGFEPVERLRRNRALDLRTGREAESQKLSDLRSRHRTLRLINLELERGRDESRDALHHPVTCPLAANVDVAVVRVANKAMASALQFPVEFVEYDVAEQW